MGLMPRLATKNPIHRVPFCSAGNFPEGDAERSLRGVGNNGIAELNF
jgi:hypothetical protein